MLQSIALYNLYITVSFFLCFAFSSFPKSFPLSSCFFFYFSFFCIHMLYVLILICSSPLFFFVLFSFLYIIYVTFYRSGCRVHPLLLKDALGPAYVPPGVWAPNVLGIVWIPTECDTALSSPGTPCPWRPTGGHLLPLPQHSCAARHMTLVTLWCGTSPRPLERVSTLGDHPQSASLSQTVRGVLAPGQA